VPRAIWSGAISFGLVNVPVRMYSAIQENDLHFHLVREKDGSRIGYEKVAKKDGKPVADDEIVKAYETDSGKLVYMTDDDFEAAEQKGYRSIDISDFVPYEQIDPIYFEHTYYLGPQDGAERVYALLVRALERSGLVGIGTFVMRQREQLGALRVRDGALTLEKLFFADEVREPDEVTPARKVKVEKRELQMATELIDRFSGDFDPSKYRDTYRDALLKVIRQKQKGKEITVPERQEPSTPDDLMEALRASLDAAKGKRQAAKRASKAAGQLADLSRAELDEQARKARIKGRSSMSKSQLAKALEKA
jgi:DNA end-binding protein Ku